MLLLIINRMHFMRLINSDQMCVFNVIFVKNKEEGLCKMMMILVSIMREAMILKD